MTLKRLRLRSLLYHWRGNLAVFLGVVVGTTVLTGALLVGDSLRDSLADLSLRRLGWVDQALVAPRFFRAELADGLQSGGAAGRVAPALLLQATAVVRGPARASGIEPILRQRGGITVLGVDRRFWSPPEAEGFPAGGGKDEDAVWLNSTLARDLNLSAGGKFALQLQKPSAVPRESLMGRKDSESVVGEWAVTVGRVLADDTPGNRFSLRPGLDSPRTVFVPLPLLQKQVGQEGKVNALLAGDVHKPLAGPLHDLLDLEDWGLVLRGPDDRPSAKPGKVARRPPDYLSLESRQLLLEPLVGRAALEAAKEAKLRAAPTLVYLANSISDGRAEIPYSVVAALDPAQKPPLGPFLPPGVKELRDDQIVLADWKESPLQAKPGDRITLTYFPPEHNGPPPEEKATFTLAGFVPLTGVSGDPNLTPEFPGITDEPTIANWDPPFPYDNKRVKQRDEDYWNKYRATPKAYVTLRRGQELWGSRFGNLTSIRMAPQQGSDLAAAEESFCADLRKQLDPAKGGFVFDAVKEDALKASRKGTEFAWLFLGFSFFLIGAALLLVGLLFRLNLDRRASEIGLLLAVGYRRRSVRWLLLGEGSVVAAVGAVVGACVAMLYTRFLVQLLAALWPGGALHSFLRPHYSGLSLAAGCLASLLVSVLTVAWAVRSLGRVPPRALLAGQSTTEGEAGVARRPRWSWWIAGVSAVGAAALVACSGFVRDHEMQAMTFFGSGFLLLVAFLGAASGWMRSSRHRTVEGHGWLSVGRLGVRNAARHPGRSLLTAGLLASAAFLVVAVEAFRRQASAGDAGVGPANGGFSLLAESNLPVFRDLNTDEGRQEVLDKLEQQYLDELNGNNQAAQKKRDEAEALLRDVKFYAFRLRAGDDASCLNLYQPRNPRVLGVPPALIQRDGFLFAETLARTPEQKANPWTLLAAGGEPVPAFGENNTVVWMLGGKLGGAYDVTAGQGEKRPLRIAGLLQDSVFQSSLLVSEKDFLRLYPGHEGYNFFLIQTPPGRAGEVRRLLERGLANRGFEVTPTAERLESYLAVENTYLSTFQALGGLGLVLGSLGLAVVLLRGVWERRAELALLRALGYRRRTLGWLVLAENGFLLVLGLLAGTAAALVAVAPHLAGGVGAVAWAHLGELLLAVLLVGLTAGALAVASTLRAPLVPALRRE